MTSRPATRPPLALVCIGGCHRDLVARTAADFEPGTSCPGTVRETFGGVARNVAVLAASAGLAVGLVGRVGADTAAAALAADLAAHGIAADLTVDRDAATGTSLAVHDRSGELVAAVSDLAIYDRMSPDDLLQRPALSEAAILFADANLPADTILALAERFGPRLALDGISRAKAPRIAAALRYGPLVFLNAPSAESLLNRSDRDAVRLAEALAEDGARAAVVTAGGGPVAILEAGAVSAIPVPPRSAVDVTGAGDALTAATLSALFHGKTLRTAVECGIAAAGAALATTGALDALPPDLVRLITEGPAS